jgi:hypothetical protein
MVALELLNDGLEAAGGRPLMHYVRAMANAFESNPPPFAFSWYGNSYRACALNPYWLIQSLISNSIKEGQGARDLWNLSGRIEDVQVRTRVAQHARDEARHARIYIGILRVVFPEALTKEDERYIIEQAPVFESGLPAMHSPYPPERIADLFIQINLGEFRTRLHQLLMAPVLTCICSDREDRLSPLLASIAKDELEHLRYTADIIDRRIADGHEADTAHLIDLRLRQFNALTEQELGEQVFH